MKNDDIFYKNDEQWVHTVYGTEFKVAKAVYCSFVDTSLKLTDDNWDVEYIDGNPNNCEATNLKLKVKGV
jgi:hypothetical protein